jgi:hypothetical protein
MGRKVARTLAAVAAVTALLVVLYQGSVASASAVAAGLQGDHGVVGTIDLTIERGSVGYTGG